MKMALIYGIVFFIAAGALSQTSLYGQNTPITKAGETLFLGPVGGIGYSSTGNVPGRTTFRAGGYFGVGLINLKTQHWGWGGRFALSYEGYQASGFNSLLTITPVYLRLPVHAYYFFGKRGDVVRPVLHLGPSLGLKVSEHTTSGNNFSEAETVRNSNNFRTADIGLDGGAGLNIFMAKNMWLNVGLGFYQGLTDAVKDGQGNYNPNHDVNLNVGLLFNIK